MKLFLIELKDEWRNVHIYKPGFWVVRYPLRNFLISMNRELTYLISRAIWNIPLLTAITLVLLATIYLTSFAGDSIVNLVLNGILSALIALLTIFFTAVIFIATLSAEGIRHTSAANASLISSLHSINSPFLSAFHVLGTKLNTEQKMTLIYAHAAAAILDQNDYNTFRNWIYSIKHEFKNTDREEEVRYPYDIANSNLANRNYPIMQGVTLLEDVLALELEEKKQISHTYNKDLSGLKSAASKYELSGASSYYYNQGDLLGINFKRTVVYGIVGISLIGTLKIISQINHDFFPNFDLSSHNIIQLIVIFFASTALMVEGFYLMKFINFFRWLSPQSPNITYIYNDKPEDSRGQNYNYNYE